MTRAAAAMQRSMPVTSGSPNDPLNTFVAGAFHMLTAEPEASSPIDRIHPDTPVKTGFSNSLSCPAMVPRSMTAVQNGTN